MLVVDGYKMVSGTATIQFLNNPPMKVNGVFLYRPDVDFWTVAPCKDFPWGGTFTRNELVSIEEGESKA